MPARKQMTLVEWMIIMAILGILAAITLPTLQQAKQRARGGGPRIAAPQPVPPDGQLNTIELPEQSASPDERGPEEVTRIIAPLLPVAFAIAITLVFVATLRRRTSRRA
jgi:hypothetical protein